MRVKWEVAHRSTALGFLERSAVDLWQPCASRRRDMWPPSGFRFSMALRMSSSLCITATSATFAGLPAARRR